MTYRMPEPKAAEHAAARYRRARDRLVQNSDIHPVNRDLFHRFFEHEEYKLKRINGLSKLDGSTYLTLYAYTVRFGNVNRWFNNQPLTEITRDDIKRVYDGLEDGTILNAAGNPYKSREDYYRKVFKSKLFRMAGKDDLAREVIEYYKPNLKEVRFITEERFRDLVAGVRKPLHQLLFWLCWDFGENINAQRQLLKSDFRRQINTDTNEPEYRVNFREAILKRSRRSRSEISNHPETVALLDKVLPEIANHQPIFTFTYSYARKLMRRAVVRSGVTCEPDGSPVTWKDLRSGMACDLLAKGWTRDEVNSRLGHRPSSTEIDCYINFLALDGRRPKHKVHQFETSRLQTELEATRQRELNEARRSQELSAQLHAQRRDMENQMREMKLLLIAELRQEIDAARRQPVT